MAQITDLPPELLLMEFQYIHEYGSVFDMENAANTCPQWRELITNHIFVFDGWEHGYAFKNGIFQIKTIGIEGVQLDDTIFGHRIIKEQREKWRKNNSKPQDS